MQISGKNMDREEKIRAVINYFQENMPEPETELTYERPYELIVAVILSAQCTDKRVNIITPAFFRKFPEPEQLASAKQEEVFEMITSCSNPTTSVTPARSTRVTRCLRTARKRDSKTTWVNYRRKRMPHDRPRNPTQEEADKG